MNMMNLVSLGMANISLELCLPLWLVAIQELLQTSGFSATFQETNTGTLQHDIAKRPVRLNCLTLSRHALCSPALLRMCHPTWKWLLGIQVPQQHSEATLSFHDFMAPH